MTTASRNPVRRASGVPPRKGGVALEFLNQGQRVVEGQRLMQSAGDIFLRWLRQPLGLEDLKPRDLYVRQLWDLKVSANISAMRLT